MTHGYYNLQGAFVPTTTLEEATAAWREERGYDPVGVFDMGDHIVDTTSVRSSSSSAGSSAQSLASTLQDTSLPQYDVQGIQSLSQQLPQTHTQGTSQYNVQGIQSLAGPGIDQAKLDEEAYYAAQEQRLIDERSTRTVTADQSPWLQGEETYTYKTLSNVLDPIKAFASMLFKNTEIEQPGYVGGGGTTQFLTATYNQNTTYEDELRRVQVAAIESAKLGDYEASTWDPDRTILAETAKHTWMQFAAFGGYWGDEHRVAMPDYVPEDVANALPLMYTEGESLLEKMHNYGYTWDPLALNGRGAFVYDGISSPVYTGVTSFAGTPYTYRGGGGGARRNYGSYGSSSQNAWQWRIRIT